MPAEIVPMHGSPGHGDTQLSGKRTLLKDEAYAKIRAFILQQDAEQTFSERYLSAELDLGLGSVRSAVERLRVDGLIVVSPNSGLRLSEITSKDILDFYELRMVVECHVAATLAGCLLPEQCDAIEEILDEQVFCAKQGETVRYHQLDLAFHAALTDFHGNPEMSDALRRMRDRMYRLARRMHGKHPERLEVNAAQHRAIYEEIRGGNVELARQRMKTHLDWGRRFTLDPNQRLEEDW